MVSPFHLAIPVTSLSDADVFYGTILGCEKGRSDACWIDWNLFGHQLVTHLVKEMPSLPKHNEVDGKQVPVPHFGVILTLPKWKELVSRLQAANISFVIEPYIRFEGQPGEQATCFFLDPAGNALEFKAFQNKDDIFAT